MSIEKLNQAPVAEKAGPHEDAQMYGEELIAEIENFDRMDCREQISHLKDLMEGLARDNNNRYVVEYLAARAYDIELTAEQAEVEDRRPIIDRVTSLDLDPDDLKPEEYLQEAA